MEDHMRTTTCIAALLALCAGDAGAEPIRLDIRNPERPIYVEVGAMAGSIVIDVHDQPWVEVEYDPGGDRAGEDEDDRGSAPSGMRRIPNISGNLAMEAEGNEVEIFLRGGNRRAVVHITIPRESNLEAHMNGNAGRLEVHGVAGEMELASVGDEMLLTDLTGPVVAHSHNADLTAVFTEIDPSIPMALSSWNGDIDITLPSDVQATFRLRNGQGELYTDFEYDSVQPVMLREEDDGEVTVEQYTTVEVNGGGPEIILKNYNGDITIRRGG